MVDVSINYYDLFKIVPNNYHVVSLGIEQCCHPLAPLCPNNFEVPSTSWLWQELINYEKSGHPSKELCNHIDLMIDEICDNYLEELEYLKEKNKKEDIRKAGYIYLLKCLDKYKIGITQSPRSRLRTYITENPNRIDTIFCEKINFYRGIESGIKKDYEEKKHRGEWFILNNGDIKSIKKIVFENKV